MANGSVYKRCSCTNPQGKRLGTRCPQLRRPGGAWHPHHGTWAYQLELPTTSGTRRQLRRSGFATREQAHTGLDHARDLLTLAAGDPARAARIGDMLRSCNPGTPLPDRDTVAAAIHQPAPDSAGIPTFGEYLDQWLAARGNLAANTRQSYTDHIRLYLKPHLGHVRLDQLTVAHFETMYTAINQRDQHIHAARTSSDPAVRASVRGKRPLTPASRQRLRATARKALNDAIRTHHRGLLPYNPAAYLELPTGKAPRPRIWTPNNIHHWKTTSKRPSPVMVWTPQQAGTFLDHAQTNDPDLYPLYLLITHRGLRRGEATGLRHTDLDLTRAELTITQQITTIANKPHIQSLKTTAAERTIPLDHTTGHALTRHLEHQHVRHPEPAHNLVFLTSTGRPWHPATISKRFDRLTATSGLPPIRLHDLRHCAATYLRAAGADLKTIQETLGHADLNITANTYTTVLHELERETADNAAKLVPRS